MYCIRNRITNYIFSFHKREMKIQWYNSLIQFSICSERRCHWKSQTLLHDSFGNKYVHRPLVSQSKPNTGSRPHNSLSYLKGKKCLSNVKSPNLHPPPSFTYSHGRCVTPAYRNQCVWKNPLKFLISEMMIVNCWTLFSSSVWALFLSFYRNTWNFLATWIPFESLFDDGHSLFFC